MKVQKSLGAFALSRGPGNRPRTTRRASGSLQVISEFRGKPFLQNALQAVLGMT